MPHEAPNGAPNLIRLFDGAVTTCRHRRAWGPIRAELNTMIRSEPTQSELLAESHVLFGGVDGDAHRLDVEVEGRTAWHGTKPPGSAGFHPAGRRVVSRCSEGSGTILLLFIGRDATEDLFERYHRDVDWQTRPSAEDAFLTANIARIAAAIRDEGDPLSDLVAETIATGLHLHAVGRFSNLQAHAVGAGDPLGRVFDMIHAAFPGTVSLADMVAQARLPRARFLAAFRAKTGLSPHQYILRERFARAQMLVRTTGRPLDQIATEVGCANAGHLSRLFQRYAAMSPNAWRAKHRSP